MHYLSRSCPQDLEIILQIRKLATSEDKRINIESNDGRIRYSYHGAMPKPEDMAREITTTTNEHYSKKILAALAQQSSIRRYIGVVGGSDQHIALLGALQEGTTLEAITLYDKRPPQFLVAAIAFDSYNSAVRDGTLENYKIGEYWAPMRAPMLKERMSIELKQGDIREALRTAAPDTYFIYLSNILRVPVSLNARIVSSPIHGAMGMGWMGFEESREFLIEILDNPNIRCGSLIFLASVDMDQGKRGYFHGLSVIIEKEEDRLKVYSLSDDNYLDESALNEYLTILPDRQKFVKWFVGKDLEGWALDRQGDKDPGLFAEVKALELKRN